MGTPSHPASLLPGLEDDLLDPDVDEEMLQGLLTASGKGTVNYLCILYTVESVFPHVTTIRYQKLELFTIIHYR